MPSSAYPEGSVEAISPTQLHYVWEIEDLDFHVNLHKHARLIQDDRLVGHYYVDEVFEIENLGSSFTLLSFSEVLHMDDQTRVIDADDDTRDETLLAINAYSTNGYPVFGKVYESFRSNHFDFSITGNYATIIHRPKEGPLQVSANSQMNVTHAFYVIGDAKEAYLAETQVAFNANLLLGGETLANQWYFRSYRTDDYSAMFLNGMIVVATRYGSSDSGWVPVNKHWRKQGDNIVSSATFDIGVCCGATWGYSIKKDTTAIWDETGDGPYELGMANSGAIRVTPEGEVQDYAPPTPTDLLDGDWELQIQVDRGAGFFLLDYIPVAGSMNNYYQTASTTGSLGQRDNRLDLNVFADNTGDLSWSASIQKDGEDLWSNQMTVLSPPQGRVYHITLIIDKAGNVYPLLDYPADYENRTRGSADDFEAAYIGRTTSFFDHQYPNYDGGDSILLFSGESRLGSRDDCDPMISCYSGHNGYDVDDFPCPDHAPCYDRTAVFPAADGEIIPEETGWFTDTVSNLLGCKITINHGGEWKTVYAHLLARPPESERICDGILRNQGWVTRFDQIGIIGCSGSGCADETPEPSHLHFEVLHRVNDAYRVVDPSGWDPSDRPDPWAGHASGTSSFPQWPYRSHMEQRVDVATGGVLSIQEDRVLVTIPPNYADTPLTLNLSSMPAPDPGDGLRSASSAFSLWARDDDGTDVSQLNRAITFEIGIASSRISGLDLNTLSLYRWDEAASRWHSLTSSFDPEDAIVRADAESLSLFIVLAEPLDIVHLPLIVR